MLKFLEASISMNNKRMDESDVSVSVSKSSRLYSIFQSRAGSSSFEIIFNKIFDIVVNFAIQIVANT